MGKPHGANWKKITFEPHTKSHAHSNSTILYSMSANNEKYDELRTQKKYHRMKIDTKQTKNNSKQIDASNGKKWVTRFSI